MIETTTPDDANENCGAREQLEAMAHTADSPFSSDMAIYYGG